MFFFKVVSVLKYQNHTSHIIQGVVDKRFLETVEVVTGAAAAKVVVIVVTVFVIFVFVVVIVGSVIRTNKQSSQVEARPLNRRELKLAPIVKR